MLNVFFTVDVEVWLENWARLEDGFPDAFKKYVYGQSKKGNYGLPMKLEIMKDYGIQGRFFVVTPLFLKYGKDPLQETVGMLKEAVLEVQLHLHTE